MARPLRIAYPGAVYHVTARGNGRQWIVRDDVDRRTFLATLAAVIERRRWLCHAYCLMSNHYHLLVETPDGDISIGMRQVNGVYAQRYNRRHRRVGHLFQARFHAVLVQRDAHLLEVTRYIALNPVVAGLVRRPEHYRWSSYRAAAGFGASPKWLTCEWVLAQLGTTPAARCAAYRSFVRQGMGNGSIPRTTAGALFGDDVFIETHRPHLEARRAVREIPRGQRFADRPPLAALLGDSFEAPRRIRDESIFRAYGDYAYSAAEIARFLGLHPSTISKIVGVASRDRRRIHDSRPDPVLLPET